VREEDLLSKKPWRNQSVALRISGIRFDGEKVKKTRWQGSGVWIAKDRLATNAHVAIRALYIDGEDDYGHPVTFDRIVSIDQEHDLAILSTNRRSRFEPAQFVKPPRDKKSLRGTRVLAVGNTAGLGLSLYQGRIVNVERMKGVQKLIHDTAVSHGSSGGPLFRLRDGKLLGINHAINHKMRFSLAIPAWTLQEHAEKVASRVGIKLKEVFGSLGSAKLDLETVGKKKLCMDPGKMRSLTLPVAGHLDVSVDMGSLNGKQKFVARVVKTSEEDTPWKVSHTFQRWMYTVNNRSTLKLQVANPRENKDPICVGVVLSRVNWDAVVK
jgi:hypothetical protein